MARPASTLAPPTETARGTTKRERILRALEPRAILAVALGQAARRARAVARDLDLLRDRLHRAIDVLALLLRRELGEIGVRHQLEVRAQAIGVATCFAQQLGCGARDGF